MDAQMSGPNWNLDEDLKTVTVTFPSDLQVQLKLDAGQIDDMLVNLGEFRSYMEPPVHADWAPGQKVGVISNPRWFSEPELMEGNSLLHIRDPRYAWLHYMIPRGEAEKLSDILKSQSESPPPGQPRDKPH